nr:glycine-rich RNA-binding protein 6, mitochondrial [Ipomoea batatas]
MAFSSAFRGILGGRLMPSSIFQSQFASLRFCSTLTTSKLFVSGLSRYTSDEGLKNAFEQFGKLVESNEIAALYLAKFLLPSRRFTVPSYLFKASMY